MSAQPIDDLPADHSRIGAQASDVGGQPLDPGHIKGDAHFPPAGVEASASDDHPPDDTQRVCVVAGDSVTDPDQHASDTHERPAGDSDAFLLIYADALDDLERVRIATENRVRSLVQVKGGEGTPEIDRMRALVDALDAIEHGAELELKRALRKHPLGPWVKATVGIGEKQGARLLAAIGWPTRRTDGTARTVSSLWAYSGYHVWNDPDQCCADTQGSFAGVAPSRKRGTKANWNSTAKMRAFLVAESCMKQRTSPYRKTYDDGRAKYAESVHTFDCVRCGPSGKPALAGSPLSDGHKHARAMRLVAKQILKDLWLEATRIDEEGAA